MRVSSRRWTWREVSMPLAPEAKSAALSHQLVSGMEPSEAQSDFEAHSTYFDPEMPEESEQQFSASLDAPAERPNFVLDTELQDEPAASKVSAIDPPVPSDAGTQSPAAPDSKNASAADLNDLDSGASWRNEVSARVSSYKSRKPRQDRYPSLQLPFDNSRYTTPAPKPGAECKPELVVKSEATLAFDEPATPRAPIILESTARVLEFPRPVEFAPQREELAEPVISQPRILEAPEFQPAPPALGGILIEAPNQPEPERRPGFDMPLQSATISRRMLAAGIDGIFVSFALAVFAYFIVRFSGPIHELRMAAEIGAILIAILWAAYQYAFLVFSGTTPGLRACGLALTRFDGRPASRNLRRWRALASLLSAISLGLGYAWCFMDEDQLSWHDRITRTHLAPGG